MTDCIPPTDQSAYAKDSRFYSDTVDTLRRMLESLDGIAPQDRKAVLAFLAAYYGWQIG